MNFLDKFADKITDWIGTTTSLVFHTIIFMGILSLYFFGTPITSILLFLTTLVSLEAIYISLLIQRAVNRQKIAIDHVEESVDEIEKGIDEIEEEIEDIEEEIHSNNQKIKL